MRRLTGKDGVLPAWMDPLTEPRWLSASQAGDRMRPEDPVLGLEFDGRAWALPWWIMKNHHVSNLTLGGRPVLANLCEVCSSAAAFDPVIDGKRHWFRLAGLHGGTIMPEDDETHTLWTGFTGAALDGPLKGRVMRRLPLRQATWAEWLELYPDSLVPEGEGEARDGHGEGQSPGSPVIGHGMRPMLEHVDLRLPHHTLVLGVQAGAEARCYPLAELAAAGPVINESLGGEDIAVFCRPGTWMAIAFRRAIDGRRLGFRAAQGGIEDEETGSRWELSGLCSAGPLRGRRLEYVHSGIEEFFIWAAFHPATGIFHRAGAPPAPPASGFWSGDWVPDILGGTLHQARWWERGSTLLDLDCGDAMAAAWLGESGFQVLALGADADRIERARRTFRGVPRLAFGVADLRAPQALERRFDCILDQGLFAGLDADGRRAYAANVAAAARPGAHFLLLLPVPADGPKACKAEVLRWLGPAFEIVAERMLPKPPSERAAPHYGLGLVRS